MEEGLHGEELNILYSSPKLLRVVDSRTVRWEDYVVRERVVWMLWKITLNLIENKPTRNLTYADNANIGRK